ncbi:hypothetical protein BdWA1_003034 [Babesia duncani]|uniref:Uncharacterized protein n=1 Tax=Babesia duncani TaxID=323732 RepID=A0AAD9PJ60_9APIC|nr:hypothetical protein BdWA1_003034 [Babesia duncani]
MLATSRQHGWRFEKLRPIRRRWVRIHHPPRERSNIIKLDGGHDKLIYICNGWIDPNEAQNFLQEARHAVKDNENVKTPVLAFAKGKSHE